MQIIVGLATVYTIVSWLMPSPAVGGSPFDFDGKWVGTMQTADLGNCGNRRTSLPVHIIHVENGRLKSYSFMTSNGPLPMTGGFLASGRFDASGYQPGKGAISFAGQVRDNGLQGRWSAQARPGDSCSGTFSFVRD